MRDAERRKKEASKVKQTTEQSNTCTLLGKVTALGVLCCFALFVCLTLLASFFLPSHLSFKNMYILQLKIDSSASYKDYWRLHCVAVNA